MNHKQSTPRQILSLLLIIGSLSIPVAHVHAAPGDPVTGEIKVNTFLDGDKRSACIAMAPDGKHIIAWEDGGIANIQQDGNGDGVFAQLYASSGEKQGGEFSVNTTFQQDQNRCATAMDADGNFIQLWSHDIFTSVDLMSQRYNSSGQALGGETLEAVDIQSGVINSSPSSVAMAPNGDYVVTWSFGPIILEAQRYNANGTPAGGVITVSTTGTSLLAPSVAMDAQGNFVIVWLDGNSGTNPPVIARLYSSNGVPLGPQFQVNNVNIGNLSNDLKVSVAMDLDGNFVVVWVDNNGLDGDSSGVFMQRYNAAGVQQGGQQQVNTFSTLQQSAPEVGMDAFGNFVITWQSESQDGSSDGIVARRFGANGQVLGAEFVVNVFTPSRQRRPDIAVDADGDFVITWNSIGQSGTGLDVYKRHFAGSESVDLSIVVDDGGVIFQETGEAMQYDITITNNSASPVLSGNVNKDMVLQHVRSASGIKITDTLGSGVTFGSHTGTDWSCNEADNVVDCTYGKSLAPGAQATLTLNVTAPESVTKLANNVSVTSHQFDPDMSNNTDKVGTNITGAGGAGTGQGSLGWYWWLLGVVGLLRLSSRANTHCHPDRAQRVEESPEEIVK